MHQGRKEDSELEPKIARTHPPAESQVYLLHKLEATLAGHADQAVVRLHVVFFEALEARRQGRSLQDL